MKFTIGFVLRVCLDFVQAQQFKPGLTIDFEQLSDMEVIAQKMIPEIGQATGMSGAAREGATFFDSIDVTCDQRSYGQ